MPQLRRHRYHNSSITKVNKGLYLVLLGDATLANMSVIPATVFSNPDGARYNPVANCYLNKIHENSTVFFATTTIVSLACVTVQPVTGESIHKQVVFSPVHPNRVGDHPKCTT